LRIVRWPSLLRPQPSPSHRYRRRHLFCRPWTVPCCAAPYRPSRDRTSTTLRTSSTMAFALVCLWARPKLSGRHTEEARWRSK
jgi:hypothetical protein